MHSLDRLAGLACRALRNKFAYAWFIRSLQLCLIVLCGVSAFVLRFEFAIPPGMIATYALGAVLLDAR